MLIEASAISPSGAKQRKWPSYNHESYCATWIQAHLLVGVTTSFFFFFQIECIDWKLILTHLWRYWILNPYFGIAFRITSSPWSVKTNSFWNWYCYLKLKENEKMYFPPSFYCFKDYRTNCRIKKRLLLELFQTELKVS